MLIGVSTHKHARSDEDRAPTDRRQPFLQLRRAQRHKAPRYRFVVARGLAGRIAVQTSFFYIENT
jgi:hypothetical protein